MDREQMAIMGGLAIMALAVLFGDSQSGENFWTVDPDEPYGPRWKKRKPPGWPAQRFAGVRGSAEADLRNVVRSYNLGRGFEKAMVDRCYGESGCRWGLPANNYDSRCGVGQVQRPGRICVSDEGVRPSGVYLVTAEGPLQWRQDTYQYHDGIDLLPASRDPMASLELAVGVYADLWRQMKAIGWSDEVADRGLDHWHKRPVELRRLIRDNNPAGVMA